MPKKRVKIHPVKSSETGISPSAKLFNRASKRRRKSASVFVSKLWTEAEIIHKVNLREENNNAFLANLIGQSVKQSRAQNYLQETPVPFPARHRQEPRLVIARSPQATKQSKLGNRDCFVRGALSPGNDGKVAQFADFSVLSAPIKPPAKLTGLGDLRTPRNDGKNGKKIFSKAVLFSVFTGLILAGTFSAVLYVFAVPPDSQYDFGATLDPNCSPGGTNCSVVSPAQYSFTTNNFSGTGTFTTTGTITAGTISTDSAGTGITISGASGVLTVAGTGNTNNENLTIDFETTANTAIFGTGTGVTLLDFGSFNLAATGFVTAGDLQITNSGLFGWVNITDETNGYQVDGLRVIANKGSAGSENLFLGQSGNFTTTGTNNIFLGYQAGLAITDGDNNNFIGYQAGYSSTTAIGNVFDGYQAGYSNVSGSGDVFLGYQAGYYETGSNKLFIDNQQRASEADARTKALVYGIFDAAVANQSLTVNGKLVAIGGVAVGADAANNLIDDASGGDGSTTLYIGNSSINVTPPSDVSVKENIISTSYGLADLLKFSVKDFIYKQEYVKERGEQKIHTGLIAQDLEQIYPEAMIYRSDNLKAIDYTKLIPLIIKSIQDLATKGVSGSLSGSGALDSGQIIGVENNSIASQVKDGLVALGVSIIKGVATMEELIAQRAAIKTARIQKLEMVDSSTGEVYCTWIENGNWQKAKGECGSVKITPAVAETQHPQASTEEMVQQVTQQVTEQVMQQTQQIQQAAEEAVQQAAEQITEQVTENVAEKQKQDADKAAKEAVKEVKEEIKQEVKQELQQEAKPAEGQAPEEQIPPEQPAEEQIPTEEQPALIDWIIPSVEELLPAPEVIQVFAEDIQQGAVETIQDALESVQDATEIVQDAGAGLLNAVLEFIEWLFYMSSQKLALVDAANKISAGLTQELFFLNRSIKTNLEKTY